MDPRLRLSDAPYEAERRRIVEHRGAEHFVEIHHDRATNQLYAEIDGRPLVVEGRGGQAPARAYTTGAVIGAPG